MSGATEPAWSAWRRYGTRPGGSSGWRSARRCSRCPARAAAAGQARVAAAHRVVQAARRLHRDHGQRAGRPASTASWPIPAGTTGTRWPTPRPCSACGRWWWSRGRRRRSRRTRSSTTAPSWSRWSPPWRRGSPRPRSSWPGTGTCRSRRSTTGRSSPGQGTVGLEIAADCPQADLVLVPVSGGGLISGIAAAVAPAARTRPWWASSPSSPRTPASPCAAASGSLARGRRPAHGGRRAPGGAGRRAAVRAHPRAGGRHRHGDRGRDARRGPAAREPGPAGGRTRRRGRGRGVAVPPGRAAAGGDAGSGAVRRQHRSRPAGGDARPATDYAGMSMRATLAYTSARILLLVVAVVLLYLAGARGLLLLALAFVVSGIASFVLLSRQRDVMSGALMTRLRNRRPRAPGLPGQARGRRPRRRPGLTGDDSGYRRRTAGPNGPTRSTAADPSRPSPPGSPRRPLPRQPPPSHPGRPASRPWSAASARRPRASWRVIIEVSSTRSASRGSS